MGIEIKPDYDKAKILFWIWKRRSIYIDNFGFRLFSAFTFHMLSLFSIYAMCVQAWGGPIKCSTNKVDKEPSMWRITAVEYFCLIKASYTLHDRNLTSGHFIAQQGIQPSDGTQEVRYHNYYVWIPYILFVHALVFRFPYFLWKRFEGKRLTSCLDMKIDDNFFFRTKDLKTPEGDKCKKWIESYAKALLEYRRCKLNRSYAMMFVFCEALNLSVVLMGMWLTDMFLGGEFRTYTVDVLIHILMGDPYAREDPLNIVFPKAVKCDIYAFGGGGGLEKRDFFCVLGVNLTNEKMFVVLWVWYLFLLLASGVIAAYRTMVIMSPRLRAWILRRRVYPEDRIYLNAVLEDAGYSDWFVLKRISDNVIEKRFGELCCSMYKELPSRSKSNGDGGEENREAKNECEISDGKKIPNGIKKQDEDAEFSHD